MALGGTVVRGCSRGHALVLESLISHEWPQGQAHAVLVLVLLLFVM